MWDEDWGARGGSGRRSRKTGLASRYRHIDQALELFVSKLILKTTAVLHQCADR